MREMKILKKVLNKFLSEKLHDGTVQVSGRIGALEIEGLHPLKPRGFAKSGNLSLSGKIDEQQVKISSMFTNDQVALRLRVTKMSDGIDLPRVLASEGRIFVEEWINGRTPVRADHEHIRQAIRDYLYCDERFSFGRSDQCDFDYLNYLDQRVLDWHFLRGLPEFLGRWREQRELLAGEMRLALCNPDLSFANFIIESGSERIVMIDTEFLHVGQGWFMDYPNSAVSHEPLDLGMSPELCLFAKNCWRLRKIGSVLIAGRPDLLSKEMMEFQDGW